MVSGKWIVFLFMFIHPTVYCKNIGKQLVNRNNTKEVVLQDYEYGKAAGNF